EARANSPNPAVHHVRWGDDVAASLRLDQRLLHENFDGLVVEYDAVAQEAVMAMAGVGIERDVAKNTDLRHCLFDGSYCLTYQIVRLERLPPVSVTRFRFGIRKERETRNRERGGTLGLAHGFVDREPLAPGHGIDGRACVRAVDQEQRPDQIMRTQIVLAHQPPRPLRLAIAARPFGELETKLVLDLGLDGGEAGFDGAAVFSGHGLLSRTRRLGCNRAAACLPAGALSRRITPPWRPRA